MWIRFSLGIGLENDEVLFLIASEACGDRDECAIVGHGCDHWEIDFGIDDMPVADDHSRSDEKTSAIAIAIFFIVGHNEHGGLSKLLVSTQRGGAWFVRREIDAALRVLDELGENGLAARRFFCGMDFFALLLEILARVITVPKTLAIDFLIGAQGRVVSAE